MNAPGVLILGSRGYAGSAVTAHLRAAGLPVFSLDRAPVDGAAPGKPFQELTADELAGFGSVVLLAGHSSVAACDRSPTEAFANNVGGFVDLVHKLRGQKLVFASSVSVYVNTAGRTADEGDPLPDAVSYYDYHKQAIERYARLVYPNSFALRFGTINGPAPAIRTELLLNSMVRSALDDGEILLANRRANRPLLGVNDLCRAVEAIVTGPVAPGCYNLASVNVRMEEVAAYLAGRFGVPCREVEQPTKYDIRVDTRKFQEAAGVEFRDTVASLTGELVKFYSANAQSGRGRGRGA